jgi:hypothetical protein
LEVVKTMHGGKSSFSILMGTYVNEWENWYHIAKSVHKSKVR